MKEVHVVETSWIGDTRMEQRPGYVYILYVVLQLLSLLYNDDALMIHLGKIEFNS